jgi:hypothetical protein
MVFKSNASILDFNDNIYLRIIDTLMCVFPCVEKFDHLNRETQQSCFASGKHLYVMVTIVFQRKSCTPRQNEVQGSNKLC